MTPRLLSSGLSLRASLLPVIARCAGAAHAPEIAVRDVGEPANLGSATHEALRPLAETGVVAWEEIPAIAERWHVPPEDVRMLVALGARMWTEIGPWFAGAVTELELSADLGDGIRLTGHVDFVASNGAEVFAGDWKTGRKDGDYSAQMRAYAALIMLDDRVVERVRVVVGWVRTGEVEHYSATRADVEAWVVDLVEHVAGWDGRTFTPGSHCQGCPRSHECAAATALVRRDVAAIVEGGGRVEGLETMAPGDLVQLAKRATTVAAYADRVRAAIRDHVIAGGDIVAPDGSRLTIATEQRRELDTAKAWPVLEALLDEAEMASTVDVKISRAEKIIAKKAGRGAGAAAVRKLGELLEAADAVRFNEVRKLEVSERRIGK